MTLNDPTNDDDVELEAAELEAEAGDVHNDVEMEDEEDLDDEPVFLNPDDAVEVVVDNDGDDDDGEFPMDDDDDEDAINNNTPDMSKLQFTSHTGPVYCVAAAVMDAADNNNKLVVVTGGGDDRAFLHRVDVAVAETSAESSSSSNSSTSMPLVHAHTDSVSAVAFNFPNADAAVPKLAAVGGYDGAILLYDAVTGALQKQLEGPTDVEWLSFHKTGTVLLAGSATDGTVWMYHVVLNKCLQVFVGHSSTVTTGAFTPDGKWAVTCSSDGTCRVWAPKTGVCKHVFKLSPPESEAAGLTCMAFGFGENNSKLVLVGAEDGQAHVCHVGTKKVVHHFRHYEVQPNTVSQQLEDNNDDEEELQLPMSVEAVGFCPVMSQWCATAGVDGVLKIWDLTTGQCRQVCRVGVDESVVQQEGITRLQWHNTLPLVFTATTSGVVRLWDARNGVLLQSLTTGTSSVLNDMQVHFASERSTIIVTGSDDFTVRTFDVDVPSLLQQHQQQLLQA